MFRYRTIVDVELYIPQRILACICMCQRLAFDISLFCMWMWHMYGCTVPYFSGICGCVWQWEGELLNTIGNPKGYILECECLTTTTLLSKYKIMCIHFDAHNLKTHSLSGLRSFLCGHQSTLPFQQASVHRGGGRFDFYPHYFVALVKSINTLTTRIEYILKRNFIK